MKKSKIKITIVSLLLLAFILAFTARVSIAKAESLSIISVIHAPTMPSQGTDVNVQVTFNDDSNVSTIRIQYCSLTPIYSCHSTQYSMTEIGSNLWSGNFTVTEESGTIGFELIISLTNGSTITAPDSSDFLGYDNIVEPITGFFYFSIDITESTNTAPMNVSIGEIAIIFSSIIMIRTISQRRKKNV